MYSRLAPEHLQDRFVGRVSNYFLRDSSYKFVVPLPRTNYLKNSFRGGLMERFAFDSLASGIHTQLNLASCKAFFK